MKTERGQSLVEMAIVTPLLIFILLGLFEVGFALRNYLVVINATREAARFAIRPGYLDFEQADPGLSLVYQRVVDAVGDQLPEFAERSRVVVQYVRIEAGVPCDRENLAACDCDLAATRPLTPSIVSTAATRPQYFAAFPPGSSKQPALNVEPIARELAEQNNIFNCQEMKHDGLPSANSFVVVEIFYEHHQLFGFPLISNPLTDPVVMYAHTTMRYIEASRDIRPGEEE